MKKYILKRTVWLILTCIVAFVLAFFIYTQLVGTILDVDDKTLHKIAKDIPLIRQRYNMDKPKYVRFIIFFKKLVANKLVLYSLYVKDKPIYIMPMILEKLKTNLILIFSIMIFGSAISIPLGMRFSKRKNSKILTLIMYLGMSIPAYMLAKIIFFKFDDSVLFYKLVSFSQNAAANLNLNLKDYIIPFVTLSFMYIAQCTKRIKSALLDIRKEEFVTTAYAYGFSRREVEYKYILKNALVPIITFVGGSFSVIFSELIVVQTALGSGGFGAFFLSMVYERQYDAVFACVIFIIAVAAIFNYLVDILYFVVDPRIKAR